MAAADGNDPLLCHPARLSNKDGLITVGSKFLTWQEDPKQPIYAMITYSGIQELLVAPASSGKAKLKIMLRSDSVAPGKPSSYIFDFSALSDRDACRDLLVQLMAAARVQAVQSTPSSSSSITASTPLPLPPSAPSSQINPPISSQQQPSQPQPSKSGPGRPAAAAPLAPAMNLEEVRARAAILSSNAELRSIYEDVVVKGGLISESEFWESRKSLLVSEKTQATKQSVGLKNSLLSVIQTPTAGGPVKITLGPSLIKQIFLEYPAVKKAYDANVPSKMPESKFFAKFFESSYFQRERARSAAAAQQFLASGAAKSSSSSTVLAQQAHAAQDDMFERFAKDDLTVLSAVSKVRPKVDSLVDLTSNETLADGYGSRSGDAYAGKRLGGDASSLIRHFNRHSEIVLDMHSVEQRTEEAIKSASSASSVGGIAARPAPSSLAHTVPNQVNAPVINIQHYHPRLDDLHGEKKQEYIPLRITDSRRYFESSQAFASSSSSSSSSSAAEDSLASPVVSSIYSPAACISHFQSQLSEWTPDLSNALLSTSLSRSIVSELHKRARDGTAQSEESLADVHSFTSPHAVPNDVMKQLLHFSGTSRELLRVFWACMPPTGPQIEQRARKVVASLSDHYDKLSKVKEELIKEARTRPFGLLFNDIFRCMDRAIERFQQYEKSKQEKQQQMSLQKAADGIVPGTPASQIASASRVASLVADSNSKAEGPMKAGAVAPAIDPEPVNKTRVAFSFGKIGGAVQAASSAGGEKRKGATAAVFGADPSASKKPRKATAEPDSD